MPRASKNKESVGTKQAHDIAEMYTTVFNDIQREAFLLGRISALLEFGNSITDAANDAIKNHEESLKEVKARLNAEAEKSVKKTTRKPRTKKEAKNE